MQGVKKIFGFGEEQKELVDPYFLFSFAGKEVCVLELYNIHHAICKHSIHSAVYKRSNQQDSFAIFSCLDE